MKFSICLLFVAAAKLASARDDVHVLMYETDTSLEKDPSSPLYFFKERSGLVDLPTTVYGGGLEYHGFGDKYQTLRSILEVIDPSKLVVVADARDVALNIPQDEAAGNAVIDRFIDTYHKLTEHDPNAVVMSAEGQCCVSAMTHAPPSGYFDQVTKKRTQRACSSGKPGCYWEQNDNIYAWVDFHRERAYNKTGIERNGEEVGDVYLNAGLMAGYPQDLLNLVNILDIAPSEDDQAVLSGLMYQFPDMIVLDYGQEMFGNNQWPRGLEQGCVFEKESTAAILSHRDTGAKPLIIHTPGKFYGCLDILIEELGGSSQQRYLNDSPNGNPRLLRREGQPVAVMEESASPSPPALSRALQESCECDCDSNRRELFGRRFFPFLEKLFPSEEPEPKSRIDDEKDPSSFFIIPVSATPEEDIVPEAAAAEEEINYGNYGKYENYGNYGVLDSNDGNYGTYGDRRLRGGGLLSWLYKLLPGQSSIQSRIADPRDYSRIAAPEAASEEPEPKSRIDDEKDPSSFFPIPVSATPEVADIVPEVAEVEEEVNYESYGQYGNYGNYGGYGNYGVAETDVCADVCASKCSESEGGNYGVRRRQK
jgi:hypothetical protein